MSGYLSGLIALLAINVVVAYSVFVPAAAGLLNLGAAGFVLVGAYTAGGLTALLEWPLPVAVAVRPEKIEIARAAPADPLPNLWRGKVREIAYLGAFSTFIVETGQGLRVRVTGTNSARRDLSDITWDDEVVFWWPPEAGVLLRD